MIPTDSTEDLSDTVRLQFVRGVAVLLIDNPPVNGLGNTVRAGLYRGLEYAIADPRVLAVVITGAGRMFCGGADILHELLADYQRARQAAATHPRFGIPSPQP